MKDTITQAKEWVLARRRDALREGMLRACYHVLPELLHALQEYVRDGHGGNDICWDGPRLMFRNWPVIS